jgi:hypothetical protein
MYKSEGVALLTLDKDMGDFDEFTNEREEKGDKQGFCAWLCRYTLTAIVCILVLLVLGLGYLFRLVTCT